MLKKWILAAGTALLLTVGALQVQAADTYGEIQVWLRNEQDVVTDGSLEICRVGDPVPEGYRLYEEFGGGRISSEDVCSPSFAMWMSEKAGLGYEVKVGRNGLACFENLDTGIYLIRQAREGEDHYPIEPFLACVSEELRLVDVYPAFSRKSTAPRTGPGLELYLSALGISGALSGIFCILGSRRREYT